MKTILTVTLNPAVDKNCSVDYVAPDQKLRCSEPTHDPGGGGLNVARAVLRLGGRPTALWTRGGATGDLLAQLLDGEGIDHRGVPIAEMTRQNLIVRDRSTGQQYRFGMPGARMSEAEQEAVLEEVSQFHPAPDYLVLSGSLPPGSPVELYSAFAQRTAPATRVLLDTSGMALLRGLEHPVYLIKPNLRELSQLSGGTFSGDKQIEQAARQLIIDGRVEVVLVSMGQGGAMLVTRDIAHHFRAPSVPIRSRVGAGDSMVGGMVLSLAMGRSIYDAARFAVAAGTAAVMTEGTELCRREDTEELFDQID